MIPCPCCGQEVDPLYVYLKTNHPSLPTYKLFQTDSGWQCVAEWSNPSQERQNLDGGTRLEDALNDAVHHLNFLTAGAII